MNKLIIICCWIIFYNCQTKNEESKITDIDSSVSHQEESSVNKQNKDSQRVEKIIEPESFETFLKRFNNDSTFQLSRIIFPFKIITIDILDNESIEYIEKPNWNHLDLSNDSSNYYRKLSKYEMIMKSSADSAFVRFQGIDNGIFMTYHFYLIHSIWILDRLEDLSN